MRLWLLSLVAGIILAVTGTPLGNISTGREEAEEEKERQDKPKKTKRDFFITGGYSGMTLLSDHGQSDAYNQSLDALNLPRIILLQLLNQTKAMNRSSEMDFVHWDLNGNITRDLCEGCCKEKEKEKPDLGKQSVKTLKHPRRRRPGQWTILGRQVLPLGNSSINMVMMSHNGTHIDYPAKKGTQQVQAENLRGGWCSGCCKDDETLEALERREGEVREVSPAWT